MSARAGAYKFNTFKIGNVDLTNDSNMQILNCNIYESCVDHHTYADVTVFDPNDSLGTNMFAGDEKVEIEVEVPGGSSPASFKFAMLQNTDMRHQGALKAKTYRFHMCSPELLNAQSTSVSKSYNDQTDNIVKDIVQNYFKSEKQIETESTDSKTRFVGNNEPPHKVLDKLKNRHVSRQNKSSSYTLFETRDSSGQQKFKFVTFEKLMSQKGSSGQTYKQNPVMGYKSSTTGDDMWNMIELNLPQTFNTLPRWSSATNQSTYCTASGKQQSKDIKYKDQEQQFTYLGQSPIRKADWDQVEKDKKPWRHTVIDKANDKDKTKIAEMRSQKAAYTARLLNDRGTMRIHGNPDLKVGDVITINIGSQSDTSQSEQSKQITQDVLIVNLRHSFAQPNEVPGPYTMVVEFIKCGFEEGVG